MKIKKKLLIPLFILLLNACAGAKINPTAQTEFEKGQAFFDQGQYQKAIPHFEKSTELDSSFAKAFLYLGRSRLSLGKWIPSIPPLRAAFRLSPETSKKEVVNVLLDAILGAALSKLKAGDFTGSVGFIKDALELSPESLKGKTEFAPAFLGLGEEFLAKGDVEGAISTYSEATELFPGNIGVYIALAKAFFKNGAFFKALDVLKDVLKTDPSNLEALSLMTLLQGR